MLKALLILIFTLIITACLPQTGIKNPDRINTQRANSLRVELQQANADTKKFYDEQIVALQALSNNRGQGSSLKLVQQQQAINNYLKEAQQFMSSVDNAIVASPALQQDNGLLQEKQTLVSHLNQLDQLAQSISDNSGVNKKDYITVPKPSLPPPSNFPSPTNRTFSSQEPANMRGMVTAHNQWRDMVNVSPLRWSSELAIYAQEWANSLQAHNCVMQHRSEHQYGENLAWAGGQHLSPQQVVRMWGDEGDNYDYDRNSCRPGKTCGHYTQVVWRDTQEVGCGVASCGQAEIWVCNYNPPGNYVGQLPY